MRLATAYEVLSAVIRGGAYANLALNDISDDSQRAFVTRVVYGVLEKYFELDYTITLLSDKRPKPEVRVLLLEGLYCLKYTDMPSYAVVNEMVELCKASKFAPVSGFVNSVLSRASRGEYSLPTKGKKAEEIRFNLPYGLIKLIKEDYPRAYARILQAPPRQEEHIRLAKGVHESVLEGLVAEKTLTGYYVKNSDEIKKLYAEGSLTYQSLTSTFAVVAMGDVEGKKVLDLCAAPGGKSIYLAERGGIVTASDIHPHRIELIRSYAKRMGVQVDVRLGDGTKSNEAWQNCFDAVLVDAPCSGLGALGRRQDIALSRKVEDIDELASLQKKLLETASGYIKKGGTLVYSICTILKKENGDVVQDFLSRHPEFEKQIIPLPYNNKGELQFLPDGKGTEGFYIARLIKKEEVC